MSRAVELRVKSSDEPVQCECTAEEMPMDYTVRHSNYRKNKAASTGRDMDRCMKSARYEVDGRKLCSFHAGIAALKVLMS